jgi:hypothetical protein
VRSGSVDRTQIQEWVNYMRPGAGTPPPPSPPRPRLGQDEQDWVPIPDCMWPDVVSSLAGLETLWRATQFEDQDLESEWYVYDWEDLKVLAECILDYLRASVAEPAEFPVTGLENLPETFQLTSEHEQWAIRTHESTAEGNYIRTFPPSRGNRTIRPGRGPRPRVAGVRAQGVPHDRLPGGGGSRSSPR